MGEASELGERRRPRVALLVDGENISSSYAGKLLVHASSIGQLTVKCVFGSIKQVGDWCEAPGFRLVHTGTGKNSADIRLVIEAMDLAHSGRADAFALAASDGDYTHLAHYLVERGYSLVGLGEAKVPQGFRKSCTRFIKLTPDVPKPSAAKTPTQPQADLDGGVEAVIRDHADGSGWITVSMLGSKLRTERGISKKDTGRATWKAYFETRPELYHCEGSGHAQRVRLRKR